MRVTVIVEMDSRTAMESIVTEENYRGDYRKAVGECASRVELASFGPSFGHEGQAFDEELKTRGQG